MDLPYKYTVEFVQDYVSRPISDKLLDEYVIRLRERGRYVPHKNHYGTTHGGLMRYVHFYSDIPYHVVKDITDRYAKEKRFKSNVQALKKGEPKKDVIVHAGGGIVGRIKKWLNTEI